MITITRRDYDSHDEFESPGSTPHTNSELEDLRAGRDIFLKTLGLTLAKFLLWFIDTHNIPKIDNNGKGGISVMGWSLGGIWPLALLGHPDVLPKDSQKKLASYFRQTILYGMFRSPHPPFYSERPPDPAEADFGYNWGNDPPVYPDDYADFPTWASRYYIHPDLTSRAGSAATVIDSSKRLSFENMTDKELAVNFDFDASLKSDVDLFTTMVPALEKQAQAALFDETLAKEYLPDMKITWIACPQTTWTLAWGKVVVERRYEEHVKQNHQIRPIRFTEIEGANHFVSISVYGPHSWVVDMFAGSLGRAAEILENCCRNC